jgi:hypothetical protein
MWQGKTGRCNKTPVSQENNASAQTTGTERKLIANALASRAGKTATPIAIKLMRKMCCVDSDFNRVYKQSGHISPGRVWLRTHTHGWGWGRKPANEARMVSTTSSDKPGAVPKLHQK